MDKQPDMPSEPASKQPVPLAVQLAPRRKENVPCHRNVAQYARRKYFYVSYSFSHGETNCRGQDSKGCTNRSCCGRWLERLQRALEICPRRPEGLCRRAIAFAAMGRLHVPYLVVILSTLYRHRYLAVQVKGSRSTRIPRYPYVYGFRRAEDSQRQSNCAKVEVTHIA